MILKESEIAIETLENVAKRMVIAARTAPKGRGKDTLHALIVTGEDVMRIADEMEAIGKAKNIDFFIRDAQNLRKSPVVVLFGTIIQSLGLNNCGQCGFKDCEEKNLHPENPCVYPVGDLGIAIGSAVSVAMDNRIDNRVMFSVGRTVRELKLFPPEVKIIYGIPLSASSKNIFFDRTISSVVK